MKKFYGGIYLGREQLEQNSILYPIKLEYYKLIEETKEPYYGIEIVKTEYKNEDAKIESKAVIQKVTTDELTINEILKKVQRGSVTPMIAEEVIEDIAKTLNSD